MLWFRLQAALRNHPKVRRLARKVPCKCPECGHQWPNRAEALGRIVALFCEVAHNAEDGNLRHFDNADIGEAAFVDNALSDEFVDALIACAFLDIARGGKQGRTLLVHEWLNWNAPNIKARQRKDRWKERHQNVPYVDSGTSSERSGNVPATPTDGRTDVRTDVRTDSVTPLPPGVREIAPLKEYGHRGVLRAMGEVWFDNAELLGIGWRDKSPALYAWDTTVEGWEWTRKHLAKGLREEGAKNG